jgi:hypothetical protein
MSDFKALEKTLLKGTVVERRWSTLEKDITVANGKPKWNEPEPAYNAKYPFNKVTETEAGHIVEMDDTPGGERIHMSHVVGTYVEIDKTGTMRRKVVGDNYEIIVRNNNVYIKGNCNVTVEGAYNLMVKDTCDIEISGATKVVIKDDVNVQISGDANVTVKGDLNASAKNIAFNAEQNVSIKAGKSLNLQAGANLSAQAGSSMKLNAGTMSLDAGNIALNGGGALGGIAGSLGGGALTGALGPAVGGLTGLSGLADLAGVADLSSLGDLSGLKVGSLTDLAGFDVGSLGSLTGLNITSLGDLANINPSALNMTSIQGLVNLNPTDLSKLATAANIDVTALGGIDKLSLGDFEGQNLTKLGQASGVNVSKLTSLAGIKDLANISNLSNIGNQLGLSNLLQRTGLGSLTTGLGTSFNNLQLPKLDLANLASYSPSALTGGSAFNNTAVQTGLFSATSLTQGNSVVKSASSGILGSLKLPASVSSALGPTTDVSQLGLQVSQLGTRLGGLGIVSNLLRGSTDTGVRYDFAPLTETQTGRPVVNEFANFTDFPETLRLSQYYTLGDVTSRVSEPALQDALQAQNGLSEAEISHNLKALAVNVLDPIRSQYDNVQILSGFQVSTSADNCCTRGRGARLQFAGTRKNQYYNIASWIKTNIPFDQLILNYKTTGDEQPWIYVSYNQAGNREVTAPDKIMTYMNNVKAMDGLVDLSGEA